MYSSSRRNRYKSAVLSSLLLWFPPLCGAKDAWRPRCKRSNALFLGLRSENFKRTLSQLSANRRGKAVYCVYCICNTCAENRVKLIMLETIHADRKHTWPVSCERLMSVYMPAIRSHSSRFWSSKAISWWHNMCGQCVGPKFAGGSCWMFPLSFQWNQWNHIRIMIML